MDIFDELFAEVRADMTRREGEVDQLATKAIKAVDAWRTAKRAALKYELASRMGLKREVPTGASDAALAILAACEQIPECAQAMRDMRGESEGEQFVRAGAVVHESLKELERRGVINDRTDPLKLRATIAAVGAGLNYYRDFVALPADIREAIDSRPATNDAPALPPVRSLTEAARALAPVEPEPLRLMPSAYPALARQSLPLVIVGGISSPEKLRWVQCGAPKTEWLELPKQASNANGVLGRLHGRQFSSMILLSGMVKSDHAQQVKNAAAAAGLPFECVDDAGQGKMREAMKALDAKLRDAS